MKDCKHKRIKRNYPFGRKSTPVRVCKDCGKLITGQDMKEIRRNKRK